MRIYCGGTFDLLHPGHIRLFQFAKRFPNAFLIVSLNTDEFAESYKRKPVMSLEQRIEVVRAIKYVDLVMVNKGGKDSRPAILESHATHILHGDDWTGKSLMDQMGVSDEWMKEHGISLIYGPYTKGVSTSQIISKI